MGTAGGIPHGAVDGQDEKTEMLQQLKSVKLLLSQRPQIADQFGTLAEAVRCADAAGAGHLLNRADGPERGETNACWL